MKAIQWSEESVLPLGPLLLNPMQRNSYTAKVPVRSGRIILIALPPRAASHPTTFWEARVRDFAEQVAALGYDAAEMHPRDPG